MLKLISLRLDELEDGSFRVTLNIKANNKLVVTQTGNLPTANYLIELYRQWQEIYRGLGFTYRNASELIEGYLDWLEGDFDVNLFYRAISAQEVIYDGSLETAIAECQKLSRNLATELSRWLSPSYSPGFLPIDRRIREYLNEGDEVRVFIITPLQNLRKLPWHSWDLFEFYPKSEVALSIINYTAPSQTFSPSDRVRILAVLGNSKGINIEEDRQQLESLPYAEVEFLIEPNRDELHDALWTQSWDIFFFAGHSKTEAETGIIYLNQKDYFDLKDFRQALKKAVANGLQIAIFNSCDGLGLAKELEQLNIPQTIVMRELICDRVAQIFLKYFLESFAAGESLYTAVREARGRLEGLEDKYPCASWLPIICQNSAVRPPTWEELWRKSRASHFEMGFFSALVVSLAIALLVIGLRSLGWLELLELKAIDFLLRNRFESGSDERLLIVEVTEAEIKDSGYPLLPDSTLARLLEKLEQNQPRVIGLNIYRDRPVSDGYEDLARYFQQSDRVIGICSTKIPNDPNKPGISPPRYLPSSQIGFSDMVEDVDGVIRRQLLFMDTLNEDPCGINFSFSIRVALKYLAEDNISPQKISDREIKIGSLKLKDLSANAGGYHRLDDGGFQLLLNYRRNLARRVTLSQILKDLVDPDWIRGKAILIGVTAPISGSSSSLTPYSKAFFPYETSERLLIQGQMVSQIISAVKDDRPILWVWQKRWELLLVVLWSTIGGAIGIVFERRKIAIIITFSAAIVLSGICFLILWLFGGWIPLIPPLLALLLTNIFVLRFRKFQLNI